MEYHFGGILWCCHQVLAQGDWSGEPLISGVSFWRDPMVLSSSAGWHKETGHWSGEPLISGVSLWREPMVLSSSAGTRRLVR